MMTMLPEYSMMSTISTTFIFGLIFLFIAKQNNRLYMILWGLCWIVYSLMFFLDFANLVDIYRNQYYIAQKQILSLLGAMLFLAGTHNFFSLKLPKHFYPLIATFLLSIVSSVFSKQLYDMVVVPNIMFSTFLLIWAGCMFISYTWTQNIPEKLIVSFLTILWAIFSNHFGFTLNHVVMATFNYFTGLFIVNLLILFLMIIHFKKTRFLLMKSEDRYRLLVENATDSMFLYSYKKREFQYISPSVQPLLGIPAAELYRYPERFFENIDIHSEDRELLYLFLRPIRTSSMAILSLKKNNLPVKWFEMHYLPISDALGIPIAVEGILRDITERKEIEESLKASESARKELIENISHELRTPITLIQGYTESMLNEVVPPSSVPSYLKMIHFKTLMLNTLLEDLIQVSHFTSQTLDYKFYELDPLQHFKGVISQWEFHIKNSGRTFHSENNISEGLLVIMDPSRVDQVISNLINNSLRYTPSKGTISIECSSYSDNGTSSSAKGSTSVAILEGEIIFTVTDTGKGIHPDDLPHIFERKFQGRNKPERRENGSYAGLGLFISLQIIKQHSGRMWAKNNPSGGTQISFAIPYYKAPEL